MESLGIFVSHSHKYADMAKSLKNSLVRLNSNSKRPLNVMISEEMAVAKDWRKWIDESIDATDVFVLLYPHTSMDMNWCNYEIGRFYDRDDNVVCIRNTNITKSPPVFEPYQAVEGSQAGFTKFLEDLFAKGALTKGEILNPKVAEVTSEDRECVSKIAKELADKFSEARVDEQLYERRLVMSVKYAGPGKVDPEQTLIQGNEDGMKLLGFNYMPGMKWSDIRDALASSHEWPRELEKAIVSIGGGQSPPSLPPFRTSSGIFIPVIVRAEIVDKRLRQVFVIFVPADSEQLGALFEGSALPKNMPARIKSLVQLLRLIFRARWDILEPRRTEARFKQPTRERCLEMVDQVHSEYEELNGELADIGLIGDDAFHALFDAELWDEIDAGGKEWVAIVNDMRSNPPDTAEALDKALSALRDNNAKWMKIGAVQFTKTVAQYSRSE